MAALYRQREEGVTLDTSAVATAAPAQLAIEAVRGVGNLEREEVVIRNRAETSVDLAGWTLSDDAGNTFRFGSQRLFAGAELRVATRGGADLPTQLFWGLPAPIWSSGTRVTLTSPDGTLQIDYTVP